MSNKIAVFHFRLEDNTKLSLFYKLQQNSLCDKWIKKVNQRKSENTSRLDLTLFNKNGKHVKQCLDKLNSIIDYLNPLYDRLLPRFDDTSVVNQDTLNFLHEEFEEYGERHAINELNQTYNNHLTEEFESLSWCEKPFNQQFHETWLTLNDWIHITERAMHTPKGKSHFSCLVKFYPFEKGEPLSSIDKLFLSTRIQWGHLYLGYNTLGKDYWHAFDDNDPRVIINNQVKVQELFNTEVYLEFNSDTLIHFQDKQLEVNFYQWYLQQSKEVQDLIPIDDLNTLALGRYYLGHLILEETVLQYHPDLDDWRGNRHNIRHKWNEEVFSKIIEIVDIEIIER
jgi:hypothetical protein